MIRALFRLVILLVLIVVAGVFLLGWWPGGGWIKDSAGGHPIGTSGKLDTAKAREVGAEIGARAATAATQAEAALSDGSIVAKIKAKMALDDLVRARDINVDYANGVVTLTGHVSTSDERKRAVELATQTAGVKRVNDRLQMLDR